MPSDLLTLSTANANETLPLPTSEQWLSTTSARIAPDGYSWIQAVCWARLGGKNITGRGHGPQRVGETTLRVAVELARLSPCRPGVDYLVRLLRLSKRTVQYHLAILREAGLLAYRAKGTRARGLGRRASEFVWTIPQAFDDALRLRTRPSEQYIRAVRGIHDQSRPLMKRLARMAQRALRRPRRTRSTAPVGTPSAATPRCTPMGGGSSTSSSAGTSTSPLESKLEAGNRNVSNPKKNRRPDKLNAVGRRYQLARQLTQQVPWLHRASVSRIAWIIRDISDAGWTAAEVIAVLGQQTPACTVHRPPGFLASRLQGAHRLYDTPAKREALVTWWRDSRQAEADRHIEWDSNWQAPRSGTVARMVRQAFAAIHQGSTPVKQGTASNGHELTDDGLRAHRHAAYQAFLAGDTGLITSAVTFLGRDEAERLYGPQLVARALRLGSATSHLKVGVSQ
ncbi:helix-turn-helix domain-containing protein [Streptomyces syringium]|uniref:helix-turn-helix domain-containing protein n=1 Tax=Streptomyces syringium TaxID=76729 RepID=UPI0033C3574B